MLLPHVLVGQPANGDAPEQVALVDIETTGLTPGYDQITVIGLADSKGSRAFVAGKPPPTTVSSQPGGPETKKAKGYPLAFGLQRWSGHYDRDQKSPRRVST